MMKRETIDRLNEKLARALGRSARSNAYIDANARAYIDEIMSIEMGPTASNLHSSSCAGRVCLNPEHVGEEVIDVQAVPERRAITDGGE